MKKLLLLSILLFIITIAQANNLDSIPTVLPWNDTIPYWLKGTFPKDRSKRLDLMGAKESILILQKEIADLRAEKMHQLKYGNKYFLCQTCYSKELTYCPYEELIWNKDCFKPLARDIIMSGDTPINLKYYHIHPDSIDNYISTFDHSYGAWIFIKNTKTTP